MARKADALNSCGRLKPGYRFRKGGAVVKVKGKAKRRTSRKRNTTGSLF